MSTYSCHPMSSDELEDLPECANAEFYDRRMTVALSQSNGTPPFTLV